MDFGTLAITLLFLESFVFLFLQTLKLLKVQNKCLVPQNIWELSESSGASVEPQLKLDE